MNKFYYYLLILLIIGCRFETSIKHPKYTVCKVVKFMHSRGGTLARYKFSIKGIEYECSKSPLFPNEIEILKRNKVYFLKYEKDDPEKNEFVLDRIVSDTLTIPIDGWDYIPYN